MHHDTGFRFAFPDCRQQCLQNQIAGHRRARGPADDLARVQIHDGCQMQPAFVGSDVRDVRHPDPVRGGRRELTVQHIGDYAHRAAPIARFAAVANLGPQAFAFHEPKDPVAATRFARLT
jgi:hypothetical protein